MASNTVTDKPIPTTLSDDNQRAVADELQPMLVDLVELSLSAKQAHWAVVGHTFQPLHARLDELTNAYRGWTDTVAERLAAVGVAPDGRVQRVASDTPTTALPEGWLDEDTVLQILTGRIQAAAERTRQRAERLDKIDLVSQDRLVDILGGLEEQLWMLSAQQR